MQSSRKPGIGLDGMRQIGLKYFQHGHKLDHIPAGIMFDGGYYSLDISSQNAFMEGYTFLGGRAPSVQSPTRRAAEYIITTTLGDPSERSRLQRAQLRDELYETRSFTRGSL